MKDKFAQNIIKEYKHWVLYINENQSYLGRCIIWAKRETAEDLAEATTEEHAELIEILGEVRKALQKTFNAEWMNYSFLGNATRHLHGHIVPRYSSEREFGGVTFSDSLWGHNFKTDPNFTISEKTVRLIQETIKTALK